MPATELNASASMAQISRSLGSVRGATPPVAGIRRFVRDRIPATANLRKLLLCHALASLMLVTWGGALFAADDSISVDDSASIDTKIERRLNDIFAEIEGLGEVTVSVDAGVVEIRGTVPGGESRDQALGTAKRLDGVVAVEDRLDVDTAVTPRLETAFQTGLERLSQTAGYLPLLAVALVIVLVFGIAARLVWSSEKLFARAMDNAFIANLLRQVTGCVVLTIGLLLALELLDATAIVGAVLGAAGVAGLAIGFAFRDTIENYIAGVLLSVRQPFAPHDFVSVDGHEGHVARLTSRATVLVTADGNYVRIPNAKVFQGVLTNYTRNPKRRFEFQVGIGTDVDIGAAQRLARETLVAIPGVLDEPESLVTVSELGDSNVLLDIKAWVDQRDVSFAKVRSEAIRQVKERFEAAEFDMPEPIYRLRVSRDAPLPAGDTVVAPRERTAAKRPAAAPAAVAADEADVSPENHMIKQVEEERTRDDSEDLLDNAAPSE